MSTKIVFNFKLGVETTLPYLRFNFKLEIQVFYNIWRIYICKILSSKPVFCEINRMVVIDPEIFTKKILTFNKLTGTYNDLSCRCV